MTWGDFAQDIIEDIFLDNSDFYVEVTRTLVTSSSSNFGYSGSDSDGASSTIKVIPFNFIRSQLDLAEFGELSAGEVMIAVSADQEINDGQSANQKPDKITYNSENYVVRNIRTITVGQNDVVKLVKLSKSHS